MTTIGSHGLLGRSRVAGPSGARADAADGEPAVSDISGRTIPPGTGGTARIVYGALSRSDREFRLTDDEARQLVEWTRATPRLLVLQQGRRSDISGRVIGPASGATLRIVYRTRTGTEEQLDVDLTDDEVATLTGQAITRARVRLGLALAFCGTLAILLLAWIIDSGLVLRHPVAILAGVSAVTILAATISWKALAQVSSRFVVVASGITVVLTTLFAVVPNIGPGTKLSGSIGPIAVERGVSLAAYYSDPEIRYIYRFCGHACPPKHLVKKYCRRVEKKGLGRCPLPRAGSVAVYVPIETVGYIHQRLGVRWRLFDAATHTALARQPLDALDGEFALVPIKRDSDSLTATLWIDANRARGKKLYARVYLRDAHGVTLSTATSPVFSVPRSA